MKIEYESRMRMLRGFAVAADLVLLNVCLSLFRGVGPALPFFSWNLAYLVCMVLLPPTIGRRSLHANDIARNCFRSGLVMVAVHYVIVAWCGLNLPPIWQICLVSAAVPAWMFGSRLLSRALVRAFGSRRRVVFVGRSPTMENLIASMRSDPTSRYEMCGRFSDAAVLDWLMANACDEVYCATGAVGADVLKRIVDYCENHLVHFYGVPDSSRMLDLHMVVEMDGDIPLFTPHPEPMHRLRNRLLKRTFDFVVSSLVLTFVFPPVLLLVAVMIKFRSPGPIFFRQKRTGMDGRDFWCLKFRSMHVNDEADTLQATENDPRKYPFGDFMRRTSIDELPQFVNVFFGDMSVVGPRPHMLKHTEQYRALIGRYMVRHLAKPGITGWAQVNGLRGATKDVRDMARRVRHDIWYVEHWSFWLDVVIVARTALQALSGKSANAY